MQSKCTIEHDIPYVWTAGQRVKPDTKSDFGWKLTVGLYPGISELQARRGYKKSWIVR